VGEKTLCSGKGSRYTKIQCEYTSFKEWRLAKRGRFWGGRFCKKRGRPSRIGWNKTRQTEKLGSLGQVLPTLREKTESTGVKEIKVYKQKQKAAKAEKPPTKQKKGVYSTGKLRETRGD